MDPNIQKALDALSFLTTLYYSEHMEWSEGSERLRETMIEANEALNALGIPDFDLASEA